MKRFSLALSALAGLALMSGCAMTGGTDLSDVANRAGLDNVTTGDGTYEDYMATGHHTATEIGIGIGLPWLVKFMELYPAHTNEDLLTMAARDAANDGADAMINVTPAREGYYGFPFGIIGIYVDKAEGTGIQMR